MSDLFNLVLYPTNLDMCFKLAEIPSFLRLKKNIPLNIKIFPTLAMILYFHTLTHAARRAMNTEMLN